VIRRFPSLLEGTSGGLGEQRFESHSSGSIDALMMVTDGKFFQLGVNELKSAGPSDSGQLIQLVNKPLDHGRFSGLAFAYFHKTLSWCWSAIPSTPWQHM
jgi:hypothetical protein